MLARTSTYSRSCVNHLSRRGTEQKNDTEKRVQETVNRRDKDEKDLIKEK